MCFWGSEETVLTGLQIAAWVDIYASFESVIWGTTSKGSQTVLYHIAEIVHTCFLIPFPVTTSQRWKIPRQSCRKSPILSKDLIKICQKLFKMGREPIIYVLPTNRQWTSVHINKKLYSIFFHIQFQYFLWLSCRVCDLVSHVWELCWWKISLVLKNIAPQCCQ